MIIIIVLAVIVLGGYFYLHGSGSHTADTGQYQQQAQGWLDSVQHDPRFYTAVSALLLTLAVKFLWTRMHVTTKYTLVAVVAVALSYTFSGGHR